MLARLDRLIAHIRLGTLGARLAGLLREYKRSRDAKRWNSMASKQEYLEVKINRNVRMNLYFDSELSRYIYLNDYEWQERKFINAFLERGDIFVDVGANIGLYTLIGSNCVGKNGHVFAFEPTSMSYHRLLKNIELGSNGNVTALQVALSDTTHQAKLTVSLDGYDAWNSLASPSAGTHFSEEVVECDTWDSFAQSNGLVGNVNLMKIDVEGWEAKVLTGASECLSRDDAPVLMVEFTDENANGAGTNCKNLFLHLTSLGFKVFKYDAEFNRLIPESIRDFYGYVNLIACKDAELVSSRLSKHAFRDLF